MRWWIKEGKGKERKEKERKGKGRRSGANAWQQRLSVQGAGTG